MSELSELISKVQSTVKRAYASAKEAEHKELTEELLQARERLQDAQDRVAALEKEAADLHDSLKLKGELIRKDGVYWKKDDSDPWCARCWEVNHVGVHLSPSDVLAGRLLSCLRCDASVNLDFVKAPTDWPE